MFVGFCKNFKVNIIIPETKWSILGQIEECQSLEDWTYTCCNMSGWPEDRGERLIKLGDIWFSAKSILVERYTLRG